MPLDLTEEKSPLQRASSLERFPLPCAVGSFEGYDQDVSRLLPGPGDLQACHTADDGRLNGKRDDISGGRNV